jgi:hypothetical protein
MFIADIFNTQNIDIKLTDALASSLLHLAFLPILVKSLVIFE